MKPKVNSRVHESQPLFPILNHTSAVSTLPSYSLKNNFNSIRPPTSQYSTRFLSHQNPARLHYSPCVIHGAARLTLLHLTSLTIVGVDYRSWSSSSCNFSRFLPLPFSQANKPSYRSPLQNTFEYQSCLPSMRQTQFHNYIKKKLRIF